MASAALRRGTWCCPASSVRRWSPCISCFHIRDLD
jgi:hypothetical protein